MRISFVLYRVSQGAKYQFEQFETSLLPSRRSGDSLKCQPFLPSPNGRQGERDVWISSVVMSPRNVTDFREVSRRCWEFRRLSRFAARWGMGRRDG